jgi:hypothetical protein
MSSVINDKRLACPCCGNKFYPRDKITINKNKLLFVEGVDAHRFLIYACNQFRKDDQVQVIDFGGNKDLFTGLKVWRSASNFDQVETLVIVRDAENNFDSAMQSIRDAILRSDIGFPIPDKPFEFASDGNLKLAFMIFPGPYFTSGTLEDLCLSTIKNKSLLSCCESFLTCCTSNGQVFTQKHKNKLYSYLSGTNEFKGMKIGEAAKCGAWDWNHNALVPFSTVITSM